MRDTASGKRRAVITSCVVIILCVLCACTSGTPATAPPTKNIDFSNIDYKTSEFKHLNNGGINDSDVMPYNIDAITGATLTVEGPAVVSSIPLSIRELENRNDGLSRGLYSDSAGTYIYEGLDLYYLLNEMFDGDNGIILTDAAYGVELKNRNRESVAFFGLDEIEKAHTDGSPILLAYGIGSADGGKIAPFVFDAANESEQSEGFVEELDNGDGCLKLVYDLEIYGTNDYAKFSNVAYVYVKEKTEPGFKHTESSLGAYAGSRYAEYILSFRGSALGREINLTVAELESLVARGADGGIVEGGIGYSDFYSLANNAYWYVNEFEGLNLYKLLLYLGMEDAETMGLGKARTTLVSFVANDGVPSYESFSVDTLSYPDAFGFYNKNAADLGDGSFAPSNADLVGTGYPVLLAYGVNRYPYTITKADDGYLSGLSNSGGPFRVVFGKTQYSHVNGSNQVQYLRGVVAGEDILYNTHKYTDVAAHNALADRELSITVMGENGQALLERTVTVGELEDIVYAQGVGGDTKKAAQEKGVYEVASDHGYETDIYEGIGLQYFLLEVLGLPGTNGTITFSDGERELAVNLDELFHTGYNTERGIEKLASLIAFAKNGSPLVGGKGDAGYVENVKLNPSIDSEQGMYNVDNIGGPLAIIIPSSNPYICDAASMLGITSISVELIPDAYAHISEPYSQYAADEIRFYGDGLERDMIMTVADIEGRQVKAKTLDYSMLNGSGEVSEQRYRGLALYNLFVEVGIKSNAGDVKVYTADGSSATYSLASIKRQTCTNYVSPEKEPLYAMLAFGKGIVGGETMDGLPLVAYGDSDGFDAGYENDGGPLRLVVPQEGMDAENAALCLKNVVAIEVAANEIDTWSHLMSDVYGEFLDYEFTLSIKNDDSEWSRIFTLGEMEAMTDLIVRDTYSVLDIGECEGLNIWKLIQRYGAGIEGVDNPVAVTAYAEDGYKNDLLSVFYKDGLELGIANEDGDRKPLVIAYAINGLPIVDSESHEGYTGIAGNTAGPLRVVAETNQGASVKYMNKLVVTVSGSGAIEGLDS